MAVQTNLFERQERALRVDNALRDSSYWGLLDDISLKYCHQPNLLLENQAHRYFASSEGLISFFKSALIIRNNYQSWIHYLDNISESSPQVFKSFAENRKLVLFLFVCDQFEVFRLNPDYPFLNGWHHDSNKIFIHGDNSKLEEKTKGFMNLWFSMGTPEFIDESNKEFNEWANIRTNPDKCMNLSLEDYYWNVVEECGLERFVYGAGSYVEQIRFIWFDMSEFVKQTSIALSFDRDNELLETISELFPQYPELIGKICREYYLATTYTIGPCFRKSSQSVPEDLTDEHIGYYQPVLEMLEKKMNCKISYKGDANLHHEGVRSMIRKHPHLFACWELDPEMVEVYHQLCDL